MKKTQYLLFLIFVIATSFKAQTITVNEANKHLGETITVCAKVAGTYITKGKSKVIYLNLEKPYPDNVFTVVIFEKSADGFDYNPLEFLKNKQICVCAKITLYKDKPQMVVTNQEQISLVK